jgi:transposase
MPTVARRPAAQQERERLQARRLRAGELFAIGVRQAEIARQLGVSRQAVSLWHARWQTGGTDALRSRGPTGPAPRLSDQQLARVEQALLEGATANGFTGELWTLERHRDPAADRGAPPSRAHLGAAAPPAGLDGAASQAPCRRA